MTPIKRSKYVALLRGINVGGKNLLPMKELAAIFSEGGCVDVRTYIQSGNVVFTAPPSLAKKLPAIIQEGIAKRFGHRVPVIIRTSQQMHRALSQNPFPVTGETQKALHVYFLASTPDAQAISTLDPARSSPDRFQVFGQDIYLHVPDGMGRTKLTNAYFDSKLSTISTARNWATVVKLTELVDEL